MTQHNLHDKCPLCGSSDIKNKYEKSKYTLDRCNNCTVVFVKNILSKEEINRVYREAFDDGVYTDTNTDYLNFYYEKLIGEIDLLCPGKGSVLDIGCSAGQFLDVMEGWTRHGVEISQRYAEIAQAKYGENIFIGNIEDYPLDHGPFDLITLQDVLDHFTDPSRVLASCEKLLKPGGHIVIKVHNIGCLYAKITRGNFYAIIPPTHLFYFTIESLHHLLHRHNFSVVDHKFIPHRLKLQTIFSRLSRDNHESIYFKIYETLKGTYIGDKISVRKNLHDIVTLFAKKEDKLMDLTNASGNK
ncbi:MAG: hypothetical protein CMQ20_17375 [Gammaproteobacteria bacterium]|jgi:2-polyprenyl-3-methyl-5-hydroxy-6-metoxy-1,4-benzoquinol methylase|nr:hypothetical protein [Gammaproteobacteria bacterium]|tara:strand:- start:879 stop:1778 length:900 start_codon:yes stop_codon:yes gene_type:complete